MPLAPPCPTSSLPPVWEDKEGSLDPAQEETLWLNGPPHLATHGEASVLTVEMRVLHEDLMQRLERWMARQETLLSAYLQLGVLPVPASSSEVGFVEGITFIDLDGGKDSDEVAKQPSCLDVSSVGEPNGEMTFGSPPTENQDEPSSVQDIPASASEGKDLLAADGRAASKGGLTFSQAEDVNTDGNRWLSLLVESPRFESVFGLAILLNSLFIGFELEFSDAEGAGRMVINVFSHGFNFCFLVELVMRLGGYGWRRFFCHKQWVWHYLDFALVMSSVVETGAELVALINGSAEGGDMASLNHLRLLRVVRITRLLRILRIARIVKFVRALRMLLHSIVTTIKSLIWVATLVVLCVYFFGIIFTQATKDAVAQGLLDGHADDSEVVLTTYWCSLPDSMLTLFMVITNGVDWDTVVRPLIRVHQVWLYVFIIYVGFVHFALLNVVTGVFCQSAIDSAQYDKELVIQDLLDNKQLYVDKTRDLFKSMFLTIDTDQSGAVSLDEFHNHLHDEGVQAYFALLDLDTSDAYTLFKLLDADGTNEIDAEEFVEGCLKLKGTARSIDLVKLTYEVRWMIRHFTKFVNDTDVQFKSLAGRCNTSQREPQELHFTSQFTPGRDFTPGR